MIKLTAGVSGEEFLQVSVDCLPGGHLLRGVLHTGDGCTTGNYNIHKCSSPIGRGIDFAGS